MHFPKFDEYIHICYSFKILPYFLPESIDVHISFSLPSCRQALSIKMWVVVITSCNVLLLFLMSYNSLFDTLSTKISNYTTIQTNSAVNIVVFFFL